MALNKFIFLIVLSFCSQMVNAQQLFLKNSGDEHHIIERLEILNKEFSDSIYLDVQPFDAQTAVKYVEDTQIENDNLTNTDEKNIQLIKSKNHEWAQSWNAVEVSKKPIFRKLYFNPNNMFEGSLTDKYFIAINPVLNYTQNKELNDSTNQFINTRGAEVKARIGNRLAFYSSLTETQERAPSYMSEWIYRNQAVLGQTYIKGFKQDKIPNGFEYLNARGYFSVGVVKNMVNATFGFDRFKIGSGYRSLFMGDEGANYMFLNLNTQFWKLHYNNYFLELRPQYKWFQTDRVYPRKYASIHHLSMNVTRWLNLGLFESVVFSRKDRFEFQYLNPIILYRAVEQTMGSPDNAMLGVDAKINTGDNILLYTQLLFDEFKFNEIRKNTGWWANKYAYQVGLKYINVFTVEHLDLQIERNHIRPFMYTYRDSLQDYSHYNQPLAHPNGANLIENIVVIRYQASRKLKFQLDFIQRSQGVDTNKTYNNGDNIFIANDNRKIINGVMQERGYNMFNGFKQNVLFSNLNATFELKNNLFIDAGVIYRTEKIKQLSIDKQSNSVYLGLRLNSNRRRYNL